MPDTTLSQAIQEAYAAAPTDEIVYHTLEFNHPLFPGPVRVVQGFDEITAGTPPEVWQAVPFDLKLPTLTNTGPPQLSITLDNVSRDLMRAIDVATESGEQVTVTYRAFLKSNLGQAQNNPPMVLSIVTINATPTTITATASLSNFTNKRWPRLIYRDEDYPGLSAV